LDCKYNRIIFLEFLFLCVRFCVHYQMNCYESIVMF
jgi:hypothetical protein